MGHFMDGRQDIGLIGNSMTPFAVRGSTFTRISYFRESVSRFYQMARGVHSSAEKKTQPVKPGGAWVHGLWENMEYVLADKERKH